jgi:hypothetical protein
VPKAAPAKLNPILAALPPEKLLAVELVKALYFQWREPMEAMAKAGRAFEGLEALLGGSGFELQGNIWRRQVGASGGRSLCSVGLIVYVSSPVVCRLNSFLGSSSELQGNIWRRQVGL